MFPDTVLAQTARVDTKEADAKLPVLHAMEPLVKTLKFYMEESPRLGFIILSYALTERHSPFGSIALEANVVLSYMHYVLYCYIL